MNSYLFFKALHLIAVISWMAGLLYLPRIFVYHSETKNNDEKKETFKIMEKRLFLHHEPCYGFIMAFWNFINTFNRT
jgi:putative membrane protein